MSNRANSDIYKVWEYSEKLAGTPFTLQGHSRGSEKSGFYIPELKLFFDAGLQSYFSPKFMFITHCHCDHSFALPMIITGLIKPPKIYTPNEHKELFQRFIEATYSLSKGSKHAKGTYKVDGVIPGDEIPLEKLGCSVKVYELFHNVPTRGYGIIQKREKLKPELLGKKGLEIKMLKETGAEITYLFEEKMVAYLCDTTTECFLVNPELLQYKYLITECTFFKDDDEEICEDHIHWHHLRPIVKENSQVTFILIHFSMRYSWEEIEEFFKKESLPNVKVWLN